MMRKSVLRFLVVLVVVAAAFLGLSLGDIKAQGFAGTWTFDKAKSINADFFDGRSLSLKIIDNGSGKLTLEQVAVTEYDTRVTRTDVTVNGPETTSIWPKGDLPVFAYEAVAIGNDQTVVTKATQGDDKSFLELTSHITATVSQGIANMVLKSEYHLSSDQDTLTVTMRRDTRKGGDPVVYVYERAK